ADATDEAGGVDADATVEADASDGETGGVDAGATGEATTTGDSGIRDSPVEEAEPAAGTAESADAGADAAESADADADEAVETVKGIGPAYADRLAEAGVETVGDLAAAAADDLAEHTSLSAKRISRWIDRARSRSADE
ncbi:MAG: helix-hairpin-helix domain-containing protein, partial [Haloferacaceae archaeon]